MPEGHQSKTVRHGPNRSRETIANLAARMRGNSEERIMGMAAVIYKKGAADNFVWEKINVGSPARGQVRLRATAVGVNFADTYHRAGIRTR
jgi:hypothetical protein